MKRNVTKETMMEQNIIIQKNFVIRRQTYALNASLLYNRSIDPKGYLLYFHGGGLLFGTKDDLPDATVEYYTGHGFAIIAFDYGLSPYSKLPDILRDIQDAVCWFLENQHILPVPGLPWFLWGRSAGAYLCLISILLKNIPYPRGVLSYYGYGFLESDWYQVSNPYYSRFPKISVSEYMHQISEGPCISATLDKRYALYVGARQTGSWIPAFYDGKPKDFLRKYTFLLHEIPADYPPVFLTHALRDPDVPFAESRQLNEKLPDTVFHPVSASEHDFDKNTSSYAARHMLECSCGFLEEKCRKLQF